MLRGPLGGGVTIAQQAVHGFAVRLQHAAVVGLGGGRLRQPPEGVDRILDARAFDGDPLGGGRQPGGVVPVKLLGKVENTRQLEDQLIRVHRARAAAAVPGAAEVEDEAAVGPQNPMDFLREGPEPIDVFRRGHVAVGFLPAQREGR